jgi:hypothetical protein
MAPSDLQRANSPGRLRQPWPRQTPVRTDMSPGASELLPNGDDHLVPLGGPFASLYRLRG